MLQFQQQLLRPAAHTLAVFGVRNGVRWVFERGARQHAATAQETLPSAISRDLKSNKR